MRCSKCGKKIKKNSSFCIKCGAKVPPATKKEKKGKKNKKKGSKAKLFVPIIIIILILAVLAFLIFGGDRVPEKIRELKGYSYVTGIVQDKMPDRLKFPVKLPKLPFDFSFKLPDIPNPVAGIIGEKEIPDKEKIEEDLAAFGEGEENKLEFDSLEIEKRITVEKEKKDTVY
ncbi:MAG: zinc ribbon domain-containing protein, partial [Bacillota bacterium]